MGPQRKTNRRQFLKGEAAIEALQSVQFGGAVPEVGAAGYAHGQPQRRRDHLLQLSRRAMACDFQVYIDPYRYLGAVDAANEALNLIDELEDQMTVYRDHSEIMGFNQRAATMPCPVEPCLFDLLLRCIALSQATDGAFDITAGPLVKLWGFHTRQGRFPKPEDIQQTLQRVGSQFVHLDPEQLTISFAKPGIELNLGSVGKGYALDRAADIMLAADVSSFLIHGGQSSILARGVKRPAEEDSVAEVPWTVALRHPLRQDRRLAVLTLRDFASGTSGSGQQFFYHRGRRDGHVLDPRTGVPAEGVLSTTVLAPNAADADALATTFFVLGVDATAAYCQQHPELSVVFVLPGRRQGNLAIEIIGPDDDVELLE